MNLPGELVFIPVSDVDAYMEYDAEVGYGQVDQLFMDDGIIVKKEHEDRFRKNVKDFENY